MQSLNPLIKGMIRKAISCHGGLEISQMTPLLKLQSARIITFTRSFHNNDNIKQQQQNQKQLTANTALVTGATQGLGLTISQKLALEGCNVIVCSRRESLLKEIVAQLPVVSKNQKHSYVACDVSDIEQINTKFTISRKKTTAANENQDEIENKGLDSSASSLASSTVSYMELLQQVNILINCAGIMQSSLLITTKPDQVTKILNTNLMAPIVLSQKISRIMLRPKNLAKGGRNNRAIINVSSCLANRALRGTTVYAASKGGLNTFTRALACELKSTGIRVNGVCPGLLEGTDMGQNDKIKGLFSDRGGGGHLLKKEEVAEVVVGLILLRLLTGQVIDVDGGFSL